MPSFDSAKGHARQALISSMRACVSSERLPMFAKKAFVDRSLTLLTRLGIESDETTVVSEQGLRFSPGQNSIVTSWLRFRGSYEPVLSDFILQHVADGDVCVDVGANIGYFSLLFAKRVAPSGKVIAIEAAPENVRRLRTNLELNGALGTVEVISAACAPQKGEITFYLHPHVDGWSRLSPPDESDPDYAHMGATWIPVTVAADTLTALVGDAAERVSFIKVDVEGAETALTPEIAAAFPHPNLIVALEVRTEIETTLMPFQERGFFIYDLHNDYRWLYERNVPAISEAAYGDFYHRTSADVLLSRQPLVLT